MATVPIVTELTFSQLEALVAANGLKEGLQYKVTDKDWLLLATSVSTLTPINNSLLIQNGDTLPAFIIVDTVLVSIPETGLIPLDELEVITPDGFYAKEIQLDVLETADVCNYFFSNYIDQRIGSEDMGLAQVNQIIPSFVVPPFRPYLKLMHVPNTADERFKAVVTCVKFH